MGSILILIGVIMIGIGAIMFYIAAFSESVLWGLAVFFIPIVSIFFLITHWDKAKNALGIQVVGLILMIAGTMLGGHFAKHRNIVRSTEIRMEHEHLTFGRLAPNRIAFLPR